MKRDGVHCSRQLAEICTEHLCRRNKQEQVTGGRGLNYLALKKLLSLALFLLLFLFLLWINLQTETPPGCKTSCYATCNKPL